MLFIFGDNSGVWLKPPSNFIACRFKAALLFRIFGGFNEVFRCLSLFLLYINITRPATGTR